MKFGNYFFRDYYLTIEDMKDNALDRDVRVPLGDTIGVNKLSPTLSLLQLSPISLILRSVNNDIPNTVKEHDSKRHCKKGVLV